MSANNGVKAKRGMNLRLSEDQLTQIRVEAAETGLTMQAYVETKIFGEIRPRGAYGPQPHIKRQDEELPLTG